MRCPARPGNVPADGGASAALALSCGPVLATRLGPPHAGARKDSLVDVYPVPRIAGALLFEQAPHVDERGFFSRTFDADVMRTAGIDPAGFAQDSLSRSKRGVVRGLHIRRGDGEAKLVRCSYGAIFDVIVDLRPGSPTYRNWESFELRDESRFRCTCRAARTASRLSPPPPTSPTALTARTTQPRTCRSPSMIPSWPSRGRSRRRRCRRGTTSPRRSPPRSSCWPDLRGPRQGTLA